MLSIVTEFFEMSPMPSERRSQVRSRTNLETRWASITGAASKNPVRILDISRTGARLEVDCPVVPGERVRIRLRTVMEARLVYVQATPEGKWMAGCQFDRDLSDEEMRILVPTAGGEVSPGRRSESAVREMNGATGF
jgi:hypothetical protein